MISVQRMLRMTAYLGFAVVAAMILIFIYSFFLSPNPELKPLHIELEHISTDTVNKCEVGE